jgi:uncharacterized membrane protein
VSESDIGRLEVHLGRLLLAGVITSAVFLGVGLTLWLAGAAVPTANLLLTIGLFILMGTPILRVIVSLIEYVRMRDWFFVLTTAAVLCVLMLTVVVAFAKR